MTGGDDPASIGALGGRLIDQAKAYAFAEVEVAKQTGLAYVRASIVGVILAIAALLLVLSALPVLIAALGIAIAHWIGVASGLAAAGLVAVLAAGLLVWLAVRRFAAIGETVG